MAKARRYVYSVRRARKNLLDAIREEVAYPHGFDRVDGWVSPTQLVYNREQAIRDLIASVRAESAVSRAPRKFHSQNDNPATRCPD